MGTEGFISGLGGTTNVATDVAVEVAKASVTQTMLRYAAVNIATQMANMAAGFQEEFSIRQVLNSMAAAVIDFNVGPRLPSNSIEFRQRRFADAVRQTMNMISGAAIMGGSLQWENAVGNILGATIAEGPVDILVKKRQALIEARQAALDEIVHNGQLHRPGNNEPEAFFTAVAQGVVS